MSYEDDFPDFVGAVAARLRAGDKEYGGSIEVKTPLAVCREVQEEIEDMMGWSYFLWQKMRRISKQLELNQENRRELGG
jgi:hypothetical protein